MKKTKKKKLSAKSKRIHIEDTELSINIEDDEYVNIEEIPVDDNDSASNPEYYMDILQNDDER